jgi:hypothetical protein
MRGAIAGDVVGSMLEHMRLKYKDFPLFSRMSGRVQEGQLKAGSAVIAGPAFASTW